jgi:gas vesicle protein
MPRQDTNDFLTAFAIGTALGVGATLLLRPRPKSARERLMRELKPVRGARGARRAAPVPADAVRVRRPAEVEEVEVLTEEVISVGRELLDEFREEVQRILSDAREQLRGVAGEIDHDDLDAEAHGLDDSR